MPHNEGPEEYRVGKGKPPKEHQFKKGQPSSGERPVDRQHIAARVIGRRAGRGQRAGAVLAFYDLG